MKLHLARAAGQWRSTPLAILAVAGLILLGGLGIIFANEIGYRQSMVRQALVQAEILAESVAAAVDFDDPVAAQEAVDAFQANRQVRFVGVFGREGQSLAGYDRSGAPVPPDFEAVDPPPENAIRVTTPVEMAGQRIGTVLFEVQREPVSRRLSRYLLLGMFVLLAALVVASLGFAQAALRRANRQLADRAEALVQANELLEEQMQQRAEAEEQLRQSQKMQALGQLTGGIAHDFNNLLTVIQGSADMLSRDELPEKKRVRYAQAIVQAAGNAAALTGQLLAFARRQPLKPEKIDLNRLIVDMRELIDRTMGERIEVATDLARPGCTVEVDRNQLQSAILNVATNAADAMADGGRLTIATRLVPGDPEPMIALEISDTGAGMDADTLSRIFEPFFTTKAPGKGTGLGLSQVYGFASQSGGEVRVSSDAGIGTTFTLLLPCCEEAAAIAAAEPDGLTEQPPASILVVEDNEEVGAFAETLLEELGHEVTRAETGEEALELARGRDFDLVFSDVVMPGMGGLKLAEALATEKPGLPVVLATGYSPDIAQSGSGDWPVILKPYRLATLSQVLSTALKGREGRGKDGGDA